LRVALRRDDGERVWGQEEIFPPSFPRNPPRSTPRGARSCSAGHFWTSLHGIRTLFTGYDIDIKISEKLSGAGADSVKSHQKHLTISQQHNVGQLDRVSSTEMAWHGS